MLHASFILFENFCQGVAFACQRAKCDGMIGESDGGKPRLYMLLLLHVYHDNGGESWGFVLIAPG
jgi:hypothetical protein